MSATATYSDRLWEAWVPSPSWSLTFLFSAMGLGFTGGGLWAAWWLVIDPKWRVLSLVLIGSIGLIQTVKVVREYALLKAQSSVVSIEWFWAEPLPIWRVTHRGGARYDFEHWLPDSRVTSMGCCLAYTEKTMSKWQGFFFKGLVLAPHQLNAVEYRQLCKRIIESSMVTA